jgi:GTP cyclohydrolase I
MAKKQSRRTKSVVVPKLEENVREFTFDAKDILSHVRPTPHVENGLTAEKKIQIIERKFTEIMQTLGLDLANDSLKRTPHRVAKMYVNELFFGLQEAHFPRITVIENDMLYDQMVAIKNVSILTFCEHHFITIEGRAHIAYIPRHRVIGLSKVNRIARYFARRPQVQERLTKQIADCLTYVLDTPDVAVFIDAKHYCVAARGVEDMQSTTATSDLRGAFKEDVKTRGEFMIHCQNKR